MAVGHLDSQRSLPVFDPAPGGLSSLAKKLRLTAEHSVVAVNAPDGCVDRLSPGPAAIASRIEPSKTYDAVLLFVTNQDELRALGAGAIRAMRPGGLLWIAYPKGGATRGATDLPATPWWTQRDVLGELTGEKGYRPVAFVSVDDTWTAMRFKRTER